MESYKKGWRQRGAMNTVGGRGSYEREKEREKTKMGVKIDIMRGNLLGKVCRV